MAAFGRHAERKLVEDRTQALTIEPDGPRGAQQLNWVDRLAVHVVSERVGQADGGGLAEDLVGMVMLDDARHVAREPPGAGEHSADERLVDSELSPLGSQARLRRAGVAVDATGVARIGLDEHELADAVEERSHEDLVAIDVIVLAGDPVGGALHRHRVDAEALRRRIPA